MPHLKWRVSAVQKCAQNGYREKVMMNCFSMTIGWEFGHEVENSEKWKVQNCLWLGDKAWRGRQWQHQWLRDTAWRGRQWQHQWLRGTARCVHHWPLPLTPTWARMVCAHSPIFLLSTASHYPHTHCGSGVWVPSLHPHGHLHVGVSPRLDSPFLFPALPHVPYLLPPVPEVRGKPAHSAKREYGLHRRVSLSTPVWPSRILVEIKSCFKVLPNYAQHTYKWFSRVLVHIHEATLSTRLKSRARGLKLQPGARCPINLVRVASQSVVGYPVSLASPDVWCRGPLGFPHPTPCVSWFASLEPRSVPRESAHGGGGSNQRLVEKRFPCTPRCPRTPAQRVYDQCRTRELAIPASVITFSRVRSTRFLHKTMRRRCASSKTTRSDAVREAAWNNLLIGVSAGILPNLYHRSFGRCGRLAVNTKICACRGIASIRSYYFFFFSLSLCSCSCFKPPQATWEETQFWFLTRVVPDIEPNSCWPFCLRDRSTVIKSAGESCWCWTRPPWVVGTNVRVAGTGRQVLNTSHSSGPWTLNP